MLPDLDAECRKAIPVFIASIALPFSRLSKCSTCPVNSALAILKISTSGETVFEKPRLQCRVFLVRFITIIWKVHRARP